MEAVTLSPVGPESRFSEATHRCPYPHYWHSMDDHSAELEVTELLAGFVRALQPEVVIETGAAWGQTAEAIGHALERNRHGWLYSFEPDLDRHAHTVGRCFDLPVEIIPMESIGDWVPPDDIGFAFFDSTFPLRVSEFRFYRQWMNDRTIVAFHDTAPQSGGGQLGDWYDLSSQIEHELTSPGLIRTIDMPTPRGLVIGQVL